MTQNLAGSKKNRVEAFVGRLDLLRATRDEIDAPPDLLPPSLADLAAQKHIAEVATIAECVLRHEAPRGRALTVAAFKSRHGRRPAAVVPLVERVLYRSFVELLSDHLAPTRKIGEYKLFETSPLKEESAKFIVLSDLANYYATIDIDRLSEKLLARSGEWIAIDSLRGFLQKLMGGRLGIPQGMRPSDRLGDTYAEELLLSIRRRGVHAWRYADDFRMATATYRDAVYALEVLDEEAAKMGLFINDRKTLTYGRDRYEGRVIEPIQSFTKAWQEKRAELIESDVYGGVLAEPAADDVLTDILRDELQAWAEQVPALKSGELNMAFARMDLGLILHILGHREQWTAIEHTSELLYLEPHLTKQLCLYLRAMSRVDSNRTDSAVERVVKDMALNSWQSVWVLFSISDTERSELRLSDGLRRWVESQIQSSNELVAAHSLWAVAVNKYLQKSDWCSFGERALPT